jgi:putative Mn2+ efflux pump MntP
MSHLELIVLALVLAIDAVSVAAAVSPACCRRWGPLRLAGAFGAFQALMPLLGAYSGLWLLGHFGDCDHWIAFGLLELIGLKILIDAVVARRRRNREEEGDSCRLDPSCGWSLLGLSVATSIDALGAGLALAASGHDGSPDKVGLWAAALVIGLVCAMLTLIGARLGRTAARFLGSWAAVVGALVLMALGVKMLLT